MNTKLRAKGEPIEQFGLESRPWTKFRIRRTNKNDQVWYPWIIFYFSYRYMLNVLEEIPDLKEIELHLHIFANGREEEEELRKQTELLPRVTELIVTVLQLELPSPK